MKERRSTITWREPIGGLDRQEDRRKALARFTELTRQSKDDIEAQRKALRLIESSRPLVAAGDLTGAIAQLEEARKLRPNDDGVLYRLGSLYYDLRRYDLRPELHAGGNPPRSVAVGLPVSSWHNRDDRPRDGNPREAVWTLAIRLNPSLAEAHNALGNVALRLNDRKLAIASFQRASELDRKNPPTN